MSKSENPSTRVPTTPSRAPRSAKKVRRPSSDPPPRAKGIQGVPGSKNPERRCSATANRTGERCKKAAIKGGRVCPSHGGAAPQVARAARERLMDLVDPAITELAKLLNRPDVDDAVRLRAITALMDRTGFGPGATVTVQSSKFEQMVTDAIGDAGDVTLDRSLPGAERPALDGGGGHSWEDMDTASKDLTSENFRQQDAEDAAYDEAGRIRPDADTVQGEVLDYKNGPLNAEATRRVRGTEFDPRPQERYGRGPETNAERVARESTRHTR